MSDLVGNPEDRFSHSKAHNERSRYAARPDMGTVIIVKFLNFRTPEIFAVIYLKFKQRGKTVKVFCQNGANGIANSEDPDQTAPQGAV